ncbi:ATP-binding protein [Alteromonas sp. ASW11-130]|uniref:ATP-binding protein n=1 Tax=Alteromonas sp. ASW11-130 TaxID=3015775 RepID=UPI0022420B9A|nr:ATP-binding protein [Alteromonas sp. ASW11-130]MCW8091397.1 ATP-binding protein [Alteromonas sp. ASW11-130]
MKGLSLRLRAIILTLIALTLFIPLTVFTLDRAYTASLTQAKQDELKLMSLALISAFELNGDIPYMPELLYEEQLNLPDSGYIGLIRFRDKTVWQSASALHYDITQPPPIPAVGEEFFVEDYTAQFDKKRSHFAYAFTAEFAGTEDFEPVHFYIFNEKTKFDQERNAFLKTVWQWLSLLALALLILLLIGMALLLSPVRELINEISLTAKGKQARLTHNYPVEFSGLQNSINQLMQIEEDQRKRYKNSLDDLAHSLKTPLAIALGSQHLPDEARDALKQIDSLIRRQLKRATMAKSGWQAGIDIKPIAAKITHAIKKIYLDKELSIRVIGDDITFYGDKTDLMEMIGNILDNAAKAANTVIIVTLKSSEKWIEIGVEDDGPGIPEHLREKLIQRGERFDTYAEGQGIGMAVVADLITIYQGRLLIEKSHLNGAKITLQFPASPSME